MKDDLACCLARFVRDASIAADSGDLFRSFDACMSSLGISGHLSLNGENTMAPFGSVSEGESVRSVFEREMVKADALVPIAMQDTFADIMEMTVDFEAMLSLSSALDSLRNEVGSFRNRQSSLASSVLEGLSSGFSPDRLVNATRSFGEAVAGMMKEQAELSRKALSLSTGRTVSSKC